MKFGSLFTGGGGADIGAREAGLELAWGVEYIPEIADWANAQLGEHVRCLNILEADPADFEPVDFLHASPPCPSFSVANSNKGETMLDVALGEKTAEFIRALRPKYFTLENVYGYRHSQSWAAIVGALHECGYGFIVEHINAADVGVPQKRRRMIVRAVRDTFFSPQPLRPTRAEGGAGGLLPWVGWWEAVEDIAHTFPESKLAPWQVKRLGAASLDQRARVRAGNPSKFDGALDLDGDSGLLEMSDEPAPSIRAERAEIPRAILVNTNQSGDEGESVRTAAGGPAFTTKPADLGRLRAILVDGDNASKQGPIHHNGSAPSGALSQSSSPRAILGNGTRSAVNGASDPADTITQNSNQLGIKLLEGARVVALTPRALARFQTFPDWYELPDKKTLAVTIIGNAVPPLLMRRIVESLI